MSATVKAHGMDGTLVEPDWPPLTLRPPLEVPPAAIVPPVPDPVEDCPPLPPVAGDPESELGELHPMGKAARQTAVASQVVVAVTSARRLGPRDGGYIASFLFIGTSETRIPH